MNILRSKRNFFIKKYQQVFGNEKDGKRGKCFGFNLVIFCYKKLEKFRL